MGKRHIVAMGGGGFSMEPENPRLDDYILSLARRRRPRVCFVPTASGDAEEHIAAFHAAFPGQRARATHLSLFRRTIADLDGFLSKQDVIYVGGGSTANLLAVWRAHGLDRVLRAAWSAGTILCGLSAGSLCWFECGVTDSFGPLAPLRDGLGLLPGSHCPHYDGEPGRRPLYRRLVAGGFPAGYAADDDVGLHFTGTELFRAVASRPGAKAYSVERVGRRVVESPLPVERLA